MFNIVKLVFLLGLISMSMSKFDFLRNMDNSAHHWAVLVAGSNGFWNYRHQSDIFHAYHILVSNGIPQENIIVLAYDDIANDSENPIKGKVFNKPDPKGNGHDVYNGVKIDYKGDQVTPETFLAVLEGNKSALNGIGTGRVLESTDKDNVFIYFSDHGATGLIAFPAGELYADQLNKTLTKMHTAKRYKELVFYLEACESGSMFNNILPKNMKIYTTTASNPDESSWATYCNPDDVIGDTNIGSCLGDEYSVNWMEHSDSDSGLKSTLQNQFEVVKQKTKNSQVNQYGQLDFVSNDLGQYQGNHFTTKSFYGMVKYVKHIIIKTIKKLFSNKSIKTKKSESKKSHDEEYQKYLDFAKGSRIDSREAKLKYLFDKAERTNDPNSREEYFKELNHMKTADSIFEAFDQVFELESNSVKEINFTCLRNSLSVYKEICQWGEYDLKFVKNIALACEKNSVEDIRVAFQKICSN